MLSIVAAAIAVEEAVRLAMCFEVGVGEVAIGLLGCVVAMKPN